VEDNRYLNMDLLKEQRRQQLRSRLIGQPQRRDRRFAQPDKHNCPGIA